MTVVDHEAGTTALLAELTTTLAPPGVAVDRASRIAVDALLAAAAGAADPTVAALTAKVAALVGRPNDARTVPGTSYRLPAAWAAFCGTAAATQTVGPAAAGPAVVVLATHAIAGDRTGGVEAAFAVGLEVYARLHQAVAPAGGPWDVAAVAGRIGGVTAVGRLLDLSPEQIVWALGIAGGQAGGLLAALAGASGCVQRGRAAYDAVDACLLAARGFDSAPQVVEGPGGAGQVLFPGADLRQLTAGLGRHWALLDLAGPGLDDVRTRLQEGPDHR